MSNEQSDKLITLLTKILIAKQQPKPAKLSTMTSSQADTLISLLRTQLEQKNMDDNSVQSGDIRQIINLLKSSNMKLEALLRNEECRNQNDDCGCGCNDY